ncbi:hypothetical protein H6504_00015 [Candidatus Woesearchaeota archaeon]|nr:hypothetical protein [Candidatus Woesearchaeota archaeon]
MRNHHASFFVAVMAIIEPIRHGNISTFRNIIMLTKDSIKSRIGEYLLCMCAAK